MPQAILLQDVDTLGERGTIVDVSKGYLRNYLVPRKLAQPATPGALEAAKARMEAAEHAKEEAASRAAARVARVPTPPPREPSVMRSASPAAGAPTSAGAPPRSRFATRAPTWS